MKYMPSRSSRIFFGLTALIALPSCAPLNKTVDATQLKTQPPNIIVILADDLGYADVSTYQKGRIPTPNIDEIGKRGVVFTQGYVSAPICSPSRAALMTGRHQQRFGFEYNNGPGTLDRRDRRGLAVGERTIADILKARGYRTGAIGKWHLGWNDEHYPTNRGFDHFWGSLTGQTNFIRPDAPEAVNAYEPSKPGDDRVIAQPYLVVGETEQIVQGPHREPVSLGDFHLTDVMTEKAIEFIESSKGQPFFLYLAHNAPHTPLQTTRKYYDRFPNIKNKDQRVYAAMVSALDDSVGGVLAYLKTTGAFDNTIVVFLSDNGCAAYIEGLCSPEPLSGGKLTYDEGGIRVPFLMQWPARLKAGTIYNEPVSSMDILPTVAAATGASLPTDRAYDGFDLIRQITRKDFSERPALFWRTQPIEAILEGDWKYRRDYDGEEFLYNLKSDPREQSNVIKKYPQVATRLKAAYSRWQSEMVAPSWAPRYEEYSFNGKTYKFRP